MQEIDNLQEEHEKIRQMMTELNNLEDSSVRNIGGIYAKLKTISDFWHQHESKEEEIFKKLMVNGSKFPVKKMGIEHRELKGHWKVINNMVGTEDPEKIKVALDTDGRMFADKLLSHIDFEERLFESYFT